VADPEVVVPVADALDAPDAAQAAAPGVELVPNGTAIEPPAVVAPPPAAQAQ
jgi:hypothetical protein